MAYWKCSACGYEARDDKQKQEHMMRTASDPKHVRPSPGMGGQPFGGKAPTAPPPNPWQGGKGPQKP